ncbi:hypothetical protein DJ90_6149 [Paenibacillus macerans]|uniref:Uncharacterized protein n=1 Tax=Paenibacillus macerans TaxID=44252 RepID=A0A090ZL75_PAEMA|nr:hypothetical protein DJ90_6149 [Paenibacillus macerans]
MFCRGWPLALPLNRHIVANKKAVQVRTAFVGYLAYSDLR